MKRLRRFFGITIAIAGSSFACLLAAFASDARGVIDRVFFDDTGGSYGSATIGRALGVRFVNFYGPSFTVDTRRLTVGLTCTHFCQGGASRELSATNEGVVRSTRLDRVSLAVATLSLPDDMPWGMYRVRVVDARGGIRSSTGAKQKLGYVDNVFVSVPPVADPAAGYDEHLRDARLAYVGRTVQGFGSLTLDCDDPDAAANQRATDAFRGRVIPMKLGITPATNLPSRPALTADVGNEPSLLVTAIDRPVGPTRSWRIGGGVTMRDTGENHFVSVSALRVAFAGAAGKPCVDPHLWLADDWELRRTLWVHAPMHVPATTPILKHMTREAVAHILGFPGEYGSVDEMNRLNEWHYIASTPFQSTVHFRSDRVSEYDPPGNLP